MAESPDLSNFYSRLKEWMESEPRLTDWSAQLDSQFSQGLSSKRFGDLPGWLDALRAVPAPQQAVDVNLANGVELKFAPGYSVDRLESALRRLIPWRKGPFQLGDIHLDTEWRSDWKWDRISPHLESLDNRTVLDVGCGNGYHLWRMLGQGARRVIGIDPSPRFFVQFQMIKELIGQNLPADLIPVGIEAVPPKLGYFDSIFSMGILYHRRSPMDHLLQLRGCLRSGGQLVLETLVVDGDSNSVLVPSDRYAKMPNVWFIPSVDALVKWIQKCGYNNVRCVDQCPTTLDEQRRTEWMEFESLADFLDPEDRNKTVEGYPAPIRATVLADA